MANNDIKFEITQHLGTISTSYQMNDGHKYYERNREVNYVKWNDRAQKLDIRVWDTEHKYAGKGITLSESEAKELFAILKKIMK